MPCTDSNLIYGSLLWVVIAVTGVLISPVWQRLTLWYISVFKCKTLSFVPNDRLWSIHAPALFSSCDARCEIIVQLWGKSSCYNYKTAFAVSLSIWILHPWWLFCKGWISQTWGFWQAEPETANQEEWREVNSHPTPYGAHNDNVFLIHHAVFTASFLKPATSRVVWHLQSMFTLLQLLTKITAGHY